MTDLSSQSAEVAAGVPVVGQSAEVAAGVPVLGQLPELPDPSELLDRVDLDWVDLECIDQEVVARWRERDIDKLPEGALECLPAEVRDRIPDEVVEFASSNPELAIAAVVLAVLATAFLVYKLIKRALLFAAISGAVAAAAWWWWLAEPA